MDVELSNVNFGYQNNNLTLENINLLISTGEKVAIIGQNGSGKSTLAKLINGLLRPQTGRILINGQDTSQMSTATISKKIGYVFQNPDDQIFHATVEKEINFGLKLAKFTKNEINRRTENALNETELTAYRNENPFNLPMSVRKFVSIACVLAMEPEIIIFDEPTAGQDVFGNRLLSRIIKYENQKKRTVVVISHDMDFVAENFDDIVVMEQKHILERNSANKIFWNQELLARAHVKQPAALAISNSLGIFKHVVTLNEIADSIAQDVKKDN
ncbi:energy-coupling factor ABC transporter ATP-binding protein [Paucilactobacillus sp. N302-9]